MLKKNKISIKKKNIHFKGLILKWKFSNLYEVNDDFV